MANKAKGWDEINAHIEGGKSRCNCGHRGDGTNSEHENNDYGGGAVAHGHGACKVSGCSCRRFRWAGWVADETPKSRKRAKATA